MSSRLAILFKTRLGMGDLHFWRLIQKDTK